MNSFSDLLKREFKLFLGNKIMMVLFLGGPILYGALFGLVYRQGKLSSLSLIVIDNDQSPSSQELIDMLTQVELLHVKEVRHERININKVFLNSGIYAVVEIPYRFEADLLTERYPEVHTYVSNADMLPAGYVNRAIGGVMGTFNAMHSIKAGKKTEAFHMNTFRLFNPASNYFLFIWPSYLGVILQAVTMVVVALSICAELESHSLLSLYHSANSSIVRVVLGKLIPYWLISIPQISLYALYFYLFRQPFPEHGLPILLILVPFIITCSFMGVVFGLLLKTQLQSLQFLMILSMTVYVASGYSFPLSQDGPAALAFGALFPFLPFVNGFRILLVEHGSLHDIPDFILLQLIQFILYGSIAFWLMGRTIRKIKLSSPVLSTDTI